MAMASVSLWSTGRSGRVRSMGPASAFLLGAWMLLAMAPGRLALAQDEKKAAEAPKAEAPAEAPKADAAKADAAAPPAAGDSAASKSKSRLQWVVEASGPIGLFLLALSVYFTALVIKLFMEMRVSVAVPASLVDKLEVAIKDRKFQEAYDACRDNDSFLARLIRVGVANLPNGRAEAKESMATTQDEIVTGMEASISYLAIIGTLGPMIGLVGTIMGMIASFQEIALAAGTQVKPEKVAEGISTALFITLEGVSLSVPAIFFFAFFRNRIAQIAMEASKVADRTITALLAAAKQNKPKEA